MKSEQQQHQQKANVPAVKSKKRQAMTPADDFQDSDPEDDYGDKSYVILLSFLSCTHVDTTSVGTSRPDHFPISMMYMWLRAVSYSFVP